MAFCLQSLCKDDEEENSNNPNQIKHFKNSKLKWFNMINALRMKLFNFKLIFSRESDSTIVLKIPQAA